jgi:hypothetical protein
MRETNSSSCDPGHKEKRMPPAVAPARIKEDQPSSPRSKENIELQTSSPFSDDAVKDATPQVYKDMPKEEIMNGRIRAVFGLAILSAFFSLAGQLRILGLSELLGFAGALVVLAVAIIVALPQLRRNFQTDN